MGKQKRKPIHQLCYLYQLACSINKTTMHMLHTYIYSDLYVNCCGFLNLWIELKFFIGFFFYYCYEYTNIFVIAKAHYCICCFNIVCILEYRKYKNYFILIFGQMIPLHRAKKRNQKHNDYELMFAMVLFDKTNKILFIQWLII